MPYLPLATNVTPGQSLFAAAGTGGGAATSVVPQTWVGSAPSLNTGITSTITGGVGGTFIGPLTPCQPIPPNSYALITGTFAVQRDQSGSGEAVSFNVGYTIPTFDPAYITVPLLPPGQETPYAINTMAALCYNSTSSYVSTGAIQLRYYADATSTCTVSIRNIGVTLL